MQDRVTASLADNQIGPLHDDDGDKEGGMAGVLQRLPVLVGLQQPHSVRLVRDLPAQTYPFLSVGISDVVDGLRVPLFTDSKQLQRQESVLSHDHEVDEEAGSRLNHADLPVCHRYQPRLPGKKS